MSVLIRPLLGTLAALTVLMPSAPAGAAANAEISTGATQFLPAVMQISSDSGVTWVNKEVANYPVLLGNHNIVPDPLAGGLPDTKPFPTSSNLIAPGGSWSCSAGAGGPTCVGIDGKAVQLTPGRYAYMCGLHPNHMHGVLIVS